MEQVLSILAQLLYTVQCTRSVYSTHYYRQTAVFLIAMILQVPGQGPTSYLDAAQREKALQQMQQMSSAQIVSATAHMQPRMGPPVTYGGFWQHPGALGIFVETARC